MQKALAFRRGRSPASSRNGTHVYQKHGCPCPRKEAATPNAPLCKVFETVRKPDMTRSVLQAAARHACSATADFHSAEWQPRLASPIEPDAPAGLIPGHAPRFIHINDLGELAGMVGFEPTVHCTKNSCLTTWLHPNVTRYLVCQGRRRNPFLGEFGRAAVVCVRRVRTGPEGHGKTRYLMATGRSPRM